MADPTTGEPAWHADPSGRHQHRWWDGVAFTDQVADDGLVTTDTGPATTTWQPPAPSFTTPSPSPSPSSSSPDQRRGRRVPVLLLGVAGVAAIAAAAYWFLVARDGGAGGTGTFEGNFAAGELVVHEVRAVAGEALVVQVGASEDLDAVVGFAVDDAGADLIDGLYDDIGGDPREPAVAFPSATDEALALLEGSRVVFRTDLGFAGEDEQLLLVVPQDLELRVVVGPFDAGDAGDYTITIESFPIDLERVGDLEGADGEDLLEAAEESEDLPRDARIVASQLLELLEG